MTTKKWGLLVAALVMVASSISAQQEEDVIPNFEMVFGPRIGAAYDAMSSQAFTDQVNQFYSGTNFSPLLTIFGVNFEQRILLGRTRNQFAFQEDVYISGLEQGLFLPAASFLIGYRDASGLEFGFGPLLSLTGVSVIAAAGYTFHFSGIYIPLDFSVRIPTARNVAVYTVSTGFNFIFSKS